MVTHGTLPIESLEIFVGENFCGLVKIKNFADKTSTNCRPHALPFPTQKIANKTFAKGGNIVQFAYFSPAKVADYTVNTAVGKPRVCSICIPFKALKDMLR